MDKGLELLIEKAAEGDARAVAVLGKQATREKLGKLVFEKAVKNSVTTTPAVFTFEVPTVVPELRGLT